MSHKLSNLKSAEQKRCGTKHVHVEHVALVVHASSHFFQNKEATMDQDTVAVGARLRQLNKHKSLFLFPTRAQLMQQTLRTKFFKLGKVTVPAGSHGSTKFSISVGEQLTNHRPIGTLSKSVPLVPS